MSVLTRLLYVFCCWCCCCYNFLRPFHAYRNMKAVFLMLKRKRKVLLVGMNRSAKENRTVCHVNVLWMVEPLCSKSISFISGIPMAQCLLLACFLNNTTSKVDLCVCARAYIWTTIWYQHHASSFFPSTSSAFGMGTAYFTSLHRSAHILHLWHHHTIWRMLMVAVWTSQSYFASGGKCRWCY